MLVLKVSSIHLHMKACLILHIFAVFTDKSISQGKEGALAHAAFLV